MKYYHWLNHDYVYSGTSIKDQSCLEHNSMALHTTNNNEAIIKNRKQLMDELHFSLENCVFANQTHSNNIHKVTKEDIGAGAFSTKDAISDCDALYTTLSNVLIGVFSADCVPILLYDEIGHVIAAVHAGYKGTTNEILKKMLDIFIYEENSDPKDIHAYIGPAIEFINYEVDEDVIKLVKAMSFDTSTFWMKKENGKYLVDLKMLNYQILCNAGIPETQIHLHHWDSVEDNEYVFSYRKEKTSGRNLSFILQK